MTSAAADSRESQRMMHASISLRQFRLRGLLLCLLLGCFMPLQASTERALANMESRDNPLLLISTASGDIYVELFPRAAPRNVERLLALAEAEQPIMLPNTIEPLFYHYYDGQRITRSVSDHYVIFGDDPALTAADPLSLLLHEINAARLGLEEQPLFLADGRPHPWLNLASHEDFQQRVLTPLYESLGISSQAQLAQRMSAVQQQLRSMSLADLYRLKGYRFDDALSSRMPLRGSVIMLPEGASGNRDGFFITLLDAPWLIGKNTVVGQVVEGLESVQRINQTVGADRPVTIHQVRHANAPANNITIGE